ncbi:ESX secretion-associated protein EspG [Amycolatopsis rhabdoformis]|uniref:ESX secretion-associated protein EspG n=1 Tax=Amycolatopsis rhabdoformis TaxID=1448059 RepID=A0ABZ1I3E0_9PSEU|nr:ESX secretion-associated protein EspG [Amycolatopsis rhabdoformis]WSE28689.1 ESX secretion-associated protein EspG [Amycolatopsis rhabdoformis]
MTIINRPVRMPRPVFLVAWAVAELGEPPVVVGPDQTYRTDEAEAELRRRALDLLYDLGLATSAGELTAQWHDTLEVLARPAREMYSWSNFRGGEDDGAILVSESGRDAVRLITDHRTVQLDPVPAREAAEHLVDALPSRPPARLAPMSVPKAHFDDAGRDYESDNPLTEVSHEADELRRLMRSGRDAAHQLYVATRDNAGNRARSTPMSVLDLTDRGRVLTFIGNTDGEPRINVHPGHRAHLIEALHLASNALA